jgi:hypothetical protein
LILLALGSFLAGKGEKDRYHSGGTDLSLTLAWLEQASRGHLRDYDARNPKLRLQNNRKGFLPLY